MKTFLVRTRFSSAKSLFPYSENGYDRAKLSHIHLRAKPVVCGNASESLVYFSHWLFSVSIVFLLNMFTVSLFFLE